jgi:translation initiation factor 6
MKFSTLSFENNPNVGLFAMATDSFCLVGRFPRKRDTNLMQKTLKVPVYEVSALRTGFAGIFLAGNSKGAIVSNELHDDEIERMKRHVAVLVLDTRQTAIGNLVLANEKGCVISWELEEHKREIASFLGVETRVGMIAGMDIVGSLAACNPRGCLAHKSISEKEKNLIEKTLGVPVLPGSVNFGNQWIRSGLVANSNGFIAGDRTSGPELGLAAEALGFV